jgi:diaminohydroxyphosphoribosylaminopyrimidine deaminase / 5-amino-6-(5-phosphoribosylamino)uracil reductase
LAEQAIGLSDPNPRVGCIIGSRTGAIFGQGHTQAAGQAHAEAMALHAAREAGFDPRGATAWVTLEPCAHHGRTPPCCDALIAAGIARVVAAGEDPFPQVAGRGLARLRAAGIEVALARDEVATAARELNIGFFSRHERGRPWVRLKLAATLDGRSALADGRSQWITGTQARADGHAWRRRSGAVLTGIGTMLADNPRLDVRLVPTTMQPLRVVLDSRLRLPLEAAVLGQPGRVLVVCTEAAEQASPAAAAALRQRGAELLALPSEGGRIALPALLAALAERQVNELHVEAGAALNGSIVRAGLADEILLYMAPALMGPGRGLADWAPLETLASMPRFAYARIDLVGTELRLCLRPLSEGPEKPAVGHLDNLPCPTEAPRTSH